MNQCQIDVERKRLLELCLPLRCTVVTKQGEDSTKRFEVPPATILSYHCDEKF